MPTEPVWENQFGGNVQSHELFHSSLWLVSLTGNVCVLEIIIIWLFCTGISSGAKLWIVSLQRYKNTKFVHFVWKLKIIKWSFKQISFFVFIFPCCLQHIRFFICDIVKTANMMPDYFSNYKVVRCSKLLKSSLWRLEHCFHVTMWMKNMLCKLLIA